MARNEFGHKNNLPFLSIFAHFGLFFVVFPWTHIAETNDKKCRKMHFLSHFTMTQIRFEYQGIIQRKVIIQCIQWKKNPKIFTNAFDQPDCRFPVLFFENFPYWKVVKVISFILILEWRNDIGMTKRVTPWSFRRKCAGKGGFSSLSSRRHFSIWWSFRFRITIEWRKKSVLSHSCNIT